MGLFRQKAKDYLPDRGDLREYNPAETPDIQVIDIAKNRVKKLDLSKNAELEALIINDNFLEELDISANQKLTRLDCSGNYFKALDLTSVKTITTLDASRMDTVTELKACAPGTDGEGQISLAGLYGGFVGLKFGHKHDKQGNELEELMQNYYAYEKQGYIFSGWFDENDKLVSKEAIIHGTYGESVNYRAMFMAF